MHINNTRYSFENVVNIINNYVNNNKDRLLYNEVKVSMYTKYMQNI